MEPRHISTKQLATKVTAQMGPPPGFAAPSKRWYGVAALIFIGGVIGGAAWIILALHFVRPEIMEMAVPGRMLYEASAPGRYSLIGRIDDRLGRVDWSEENVTAGLRITLIDEKNGTPIPLQATLGWLDVSGGNEVRFSVGSFQIAEPGGVEIRVEGVTPIRAIGVQRAQADRLMWALIGGLALNALGWLVAPILAFQVYYRRVRAEFLKAEYGATPPAA